MKTFLVLFVVGIVVLTWYLVINSPMGWEDEDGFHEGEKVSDDDRVG